MKGRNVYLFVVAGLLALGWVLAAPAPTSKAYALNVEEMLADPALESRARHLSKQLRCLVCQNQSIDDSDADLAKDLRREVRTQLSQGKTDDDILAFLQEKYGDYVLLAPPLAGQTMALWLAPIGFLLLGIFIAVGLRRRTASDMQDDMTPSDRAKIDALTAHHKNVKKNLTDHD